MTEAESRAEPGHDAAQQASDAAQQARDSAWLERVVRAGLVAYGVVHLLVAWLALQIAFGSAPHAASQQGAMQALVQEPFGQPLLWLVAVGFAGLVVWQTLEAVVGHRDSDGAKLVFARAASAARAVVYGVLAYSAVGTAVGAGSSTNTNKNRLTADMLGLPLGPLIVGAIGLAIVGVGVALAWQAVSRSFLDGLDRAATSGASGTALVGAALFGYATKGLALGVVGGLFVWAAVTYDPKKAGGLDVALQTLTGQAVGPWLLAMVAFGIGSFGLYCFGWARYADTAA